MKRILLSIIALLTFFSSVAYSFDFHRLDKVNIEEVTIKAQQGDAEAQCTLGSCLLEGHYIEKDVQKAMIWLHKSAEQECSDAQTLLGMIYYSGVYKGVPQNKKKGKYWLRLATNNGCKLAESWLHCIESLEEYKRALRTYD
ncbi:MAG: sel1 repeat family protein [Thermoguttaceae bacterium]|nr:sel1 repeat family protein [Thermoguttaceae bacterium]